MIQLYHLANLSRIISGDIKESISGDWTGGLSGYITGNIADHKKNQRLNIKNTNQPRTYLYEFIAYQL